MVKADLARDYYADLELPPNADLADIKKQFKKLAFKHHPDRNPGREVEVLADFQRIQSAHEVLSDATEKAKYDANRIRPGYRNYAGFAGYSGGTSSGQKGNPWSDVGRDFPPPPKAPTARNRPSQSAGARKYDTFRTPPQSAYQTAQSGPDSRQDTYRAFDAMRHPQSKPQPGSSREPPKPPPRNTAQSGREENNARAQAEAAEAQRKQAERAAQAERARANGPQFGYEDYRESNTSSRRSHSTHASNRKGGFQPNTPGGDEPAANKNAYFTARDKPMAPPPPPRQNPATSSSNAVPDPLEQFRRQDIPSMETRPSQPYNTQGGEKFSLHGGANVSRSKSTRENSGRFENGQVPRSGSDSSLNSPRRTKSTTQQKPRPARVDSSSSDEGATIHSFRAKPTTTKSNGSAPRGTQPTPDGMKGAESPRKQGRISLMRQWMNENPGEEPPPNGFPPDGLPLRFNPAPTTPTKPNNTAGNNDAKGQPSMYANSAYSSFSSKIACPSNFLSRNQPSVPRNVSQKVEITQRERSKNFNDMVEVELTPQNVKTSAKLPSGYAVGPVDLTAFEKEQHNLIDKLLSNKRRSSQKYSSHDSSVKSKGNGYEQSNKTAVYREPTDLGSSSKSFKQNRSYILNFNKAHENLDNLEKSANRVMHQSFSFSINSDTFTATQPRKFSSSAENISTKFNPDEWNGKFEAGDVRFKPADSVPVMNPRAQSASRSRGRSPPKVRTTVDSKFMPSSESDVPNESPSGTKFSAEEWNETFKDQTFAVPSTPIVPPRPYPSRKRTNTNIKPTMGGRATVANESDSSDSKPLFAEPQGSTPQASGPDPMDVDTPPATRAMPQFVPSVANEKLKINTDPLKRPAESSTRSPIDEEDLTINFEDLKIKGFDLAMPTPPAPAALTGISDVPTQDAFDSYVGRYSAYMNQWDAVNKQFLLHIVTRQRQNEELMNKRWTEPAVTEAYRLSLREDQSILQRWADMTEKHAKVVKDYVITNARMHARGGRDEQKEYEGEDGPSPRKKTH